ncbi:MAG TPA: radical SAM protein, partial [Vicinamibacteria bacterium]
MSTAPVRPDYPEAPLFALDTLWFQVAGTLCNIQCAHCFISSSPSNRSHEMLSLETVKRFLAEGEALGVKEYYFTGGEPFLNREIFEILEAALALGPVSVLTNGLLLKPESASRLRRLSDASEYSLDLRISIDGWDAATNDPVRGAGTFDRILVGIRNLAEAGLNPVITVTEACEGASTAEGRTRFLAFLRSIGLTKPRLKVMPLLRLGAESGRTRAYASWESLRGQTLTREEAEALVCSSGRMVTSKGVYVCPILIDFPQARMGATLSETLGAFELRYPACFTCHEQG